MKKLLIILGMLSAFSASAAKWVDDLRLNDGKLLMRETTAPTGVSGFGYFYSSGVDNDPHWVDSLGVDYNLLLGGSADLNALSDVTLTAPANRDILQYNGSDWVNVAAPVLNSIGVGAAKNASSIFDITSTTLGSRPCPAMTGVQRDAIATPVAGLCVWNTTSAMLNVYNGAAWGEVGGGGGISGWLTAVDYEIGDVVHQSNLIYLALTAHTSGTFATDLANNDWVQLSDYSDANDVYVTPTRSVTNMFNRTVNQGVFSTIAVTDDGGLAFSWGAGAVYDITTKTVVSIDAGSASCTNNAITYLYWNSTATLSTGTTRPIIPEIPIATIGCQDGDIISLHSEEDLNTRENAIVHGLESLIPIVIESGLVTSEDTNVTNIWDVGVTAGEYYINAHKDTYLSSVLSRTVAMKRHFKTAGAWDVDSNAQIGNTQYNNGTALTAVVSGQYYKSCFYIASDNVIHWVYPTTGHVQIANALADVCPLLPPGLAQVAPSTSVVIRGSDAAFPSLASGRWQDIRPMLGVAATSNAVADHGNLAGLADDDHTQYVMLTGRTGGQTVIGGLAASENLVLQSTANATKGFIVADDTLVGGTGSGDDLTLASTSNATKGEVVISDPVEAGRIQSSAGTYSKDLVASYILNSHAEKDTTGWATYDDGASAVPVNGTGGTATAIALTRNTSAPLRGLADFLITKSAASGQGEGISYDFSIDTGDQATMQTISFKASTSANYADNDMGVYVYDVTNAVLLASIPVDISGATNGKFAASFQTSYNSTSYRLIFHVKTVNAAAYTVRLDNIAVEDQAVVNGVPVTPWETYTPTVSGLGTISSSEMYYRRVGDSVEVKGYIQAGTVPASEVQIGLPSGLTIDTTKNTSVTTVGYGSSTVATASQYVILGTGGDTYFNVGFQDATHSGLTPLNGNDILTNNSYVSFFAKVPVVGWTSNVVMSETTMNKYIHVAVSGNAGGGVTSGVTDIDFATESEDNTSSWNGTQFTAPETGDYNVSGMIRLTTGASVTAFAYVNGTLFKGLGDVISNANVSFAGVVKLLKGDVLSMRLDSSVTLNNLPVYHHINISKENTGSQTIAADAVVSTRVSGDAASASAGAPVIFPTVDFSTTGGYASGLYTVGASGYYLVTGYVVSANGTITLNICKNGATDVAGGITDANGEGMFSGVVSVLQGQTVSLEPSGTLDITAGNMSIVRLK